MNRMLLIFLLAFFFSVGPVTAKTLNKVAAVVNNDIITTYQLEQAFTKALEQNPNRNQLSALQLDQLKSSILGQLVNDKLLEQRIAELGLQVTDAELDAAITDVQDKNQLSKEELEQALVSQGMTMSGYRERIKNEILRYKLLGREVNYKVLVTSGEVRDYFREHIDQYKVQPKVRVSRISYNIPPNATEQEIADLKKQATIARDLLIKGDPFDQVLSAQAESASGGDMGELVETDLAEKLQMVIKDLEPGEVSQVLEMNNQINLFLVTDRNPGDINLFDRVKEDIEEKIRREKTDARFKEWEAELRNKAHVDIRI